jgi:phosphoglucosamine mutase
LRLMSRMAQTGAPLAGLASAMHTLPQVLINVEVADKAAAVAAPSVRTALQQAEDELGDTGRILLRPSGTEQMIRVMVEADDQRVAHRLATLVADTVRDQH